MAKLKAPMQHSGTFSHIVQIELSLSHAGNITSWLNDATIAYT